MPPRSLTPRQREVLDGAARGEIVKQTATRLHLSPCTVQALLRDSYKRLGANHKAHAVALYIQGERDVD